MDPKALKILYRYVPYSNHSIYHWNAATSEVNTATVPVLKNTTQHFRLGSREYFFSSWNYIGNFENSITQTIERVEEMVIKVTETI